MTAFSVQGMICHTIILLRGSVSLSKSTTYSCPYITNLTLSCTENGFFYFEGQSYRETGGF